MDDAPAPPIHAAAYTPAPPGIRAVYTTPAVLRRGQPGMNPPPTRALPKAVARRPGATTALDPEEIMRMRAVVLDDHPEINPICLMALASLNQCLDVFIASGSSPQ